MERGPPPAPSDILKGSEQFSWPTHSQRQVPALPPCWDPSRPVGTAPRAAAIPITALLLPAKLETGCTGVHARAPLSEAGPPKPWGAQNHLFDIRSEATAPLSGPRLVSAQGIWGWGGLVSTTYP